MRQVSVRIPTPLRSLTNGQSLLPAQGNTVRDVLVALGSLNEGLLERIFDDKGQVRSFVNIFVEDTNIRTLEGLHSEVPEGATISIVPAVAGGAGARDRRVAELRRRIPEVSPSEALQIADNTGVLIDVREADEIAAGSPPGAKHIVRGFLELRIEDEVPDSNAEIVLMCAGGVRSLLAADDLLRLGYENVRSLRGGFTQWKSDGLPVEIPQTLSVRERERYGRHVVIPEVGEKGQLKLRASKVLLVGAGGLGSPIALYLGAAGVGTIGIVDDDRVDRSNLQRQILHTDERVGVSKVESARETLTALNPDVKVVPYETRLTSENIDEIFSHYDVIADGSDNFATRYLVNDACVKLGLPNVHGSVFRFEGQVSVFWPRRVADPGPCYRCLYPEPPPPELAPSCAEAGVLGVLPGVVGTLEAVEVIKLLLALDGVLVGKLLVYDALRAEFMTLRIRRDPACRYCGDDVERFPGYVDYAQFCSGVELSI